MKYARKKPQAKLLVVLDVAVLKEQR